LAARSIFSNTDTGRFLNFRGGPVSEIKIDCTTDFGDGLGRGLTMSELRKPVVSERASGPIFGPSAQPLLNSGQAAQFLGVHPTTLQRMARRGEITGVRVGKLWRFVPSSIRDWVQDRNIAS
jgi:excisionase family DNA binding protein